VAAIDGGSTIPNLADFAARILNCLMSWLESLEGTPLTVETMAGQTAASSILPAWRWLGVASWSSSGSRAGIHLEAICSADSRHLRSWRAQAGATAGSAGIPAGEGYVQAASNITLRDYSFCNIGVSMPADQAKPSAAPKNIVPAQSPAASIDRAGSSPRNACPGSVGARCRCWKSSLIHGWPS
jgi:hypothetical protein